MSKISTMTETQIENRCEKLFNQIMSSMMELKHMYVKAKSEGLKDDDRLFHIYKACLMVEHFEEFTFSKKFKDEVYQELKEWEQDSDDMSNHMMEAFCKLVDHE